MSNIKGVTKEDLISKLSQKTGLTQTQSEQALQCILNEVKTSLKNKEDVIFRGFGRFKAIKKSKRIGRNPNTGVETIINPRTVVSFSASKSFKEKVNAS